MTPDDLVALGQTVDELGTEFDRAMEAYKAIGERRSLRKQRLWRAYLAAYQRYMDRYHEWRNELTALLLLDVARSASHLANNLMNFALDWPEPLWTEIVELRRIADLAVGIHGDGNGREKQG